MLFPSPFTCVLTKVAHTLSLISLPVLTVFLLHTKWRSLNVGFKKPRPKLQVLLYPNHWSIAKYHRPLVQVRYKFNWLSNNVKLFYRFICCVWLSVIAGLAFQIFCICSVCYKAELFKCFAFAVTSPLNCSYIHSLCFYNCRTLNICSRHSWFIVNHFQAIGFL